MSDQIQKKKNAKKDEPCCAVEFAHLALLGKFDAQTAGEVCFDRVASSLARAVTNVLKAYAVAYPGQEGEAECERIGTFARMFGHHVAWEALQADVCAGCLSEGLSDGIHDVWGADNEVNATSLGEKKTEKPEAVH
jgi:hypothetical protein